jgi:phosphopantetheinyl transferase
MTLTVRRVDVWLSSEAGGCSAPTVEQILDSYPRRDREALRHSVSHTIGALLVAVAADCRVGVDVECVCDRGLTALPRHALTQNELAAFSSTEPADRLSVFLAYWTRKEALLKAAGVGLAVEPSLIEVDVSAIRSQPIVVPEALGPASGWWITELTVPGYAASIATDAPVSRIRMIGSLSAGQSDRSARIARSRSAYAGAVGSSSWRR